jgi:hypothetical protein
VALDLVLRPAFIGRYVDRPNHREVAPSGRSDRHPRPVEQMTWCPGLPMLIKDRLVVLGDRSRATACTAFSTSVTVSATRSPTLSLFASMFLSQFEKAFCLVAVMGLKEPQSIPVGAGDERISDCLDGRFVGFARPVDADRAISLAGSDLKLAAVPRAEFFQQRCADKSFGRMQVHDLCRLSL